MDVNLATIHVKRVIIQQKDFWFIKNLIKSLDVYPKVDEDAWCYSFEEIEDPGERHREFFRRGYYYS